ncbi:MAG TPA: hypothetical protein VEY51_04245, partial [Chondromyces sp.]|nr:hypothetical protein [Chondromyces sp.]
ARSYEEMNEYLFGKWFAKGMNLLILLMLIGVSGVMLSGAGALFQEHLLISKQIGVLLTMALGLAVMAVGTKGLFAVNTFVVPLMITFNLIVMGLSVAKPGFLETVLYIPEGVSGWKAALSPILYVAFNLALSQAVLVPLASEINDRAVVRLGGLLGGLFLTILLISSHFVLIQIPNVVEFEIPMATVMKSTVYGLYWVYIFIIYGEIFTSIIGNMYGLERQINKYWPVHSIVIYLSIFVLAYSLSWFHYSTLLALLYPIFGWISLAFIILLWVKPTNVPR